MRHYKQVGLSIIVAAALSAVGAARSTADTIRQTQSVDLQFGTQATLDFSGFDATLGTLTDVSVISFSSVISVSFNNINFIPPVVPEPFLTEQVGVSGPGSLSLSATVTASCTVAAGLDGCSVIPPKLTTLEQFGITPLMDYIGGSISMMVSDTEVSQGFLNPDCFANCSLNGISGSDRIGVDLQYTFTPFAPVPGPIAGAGLPGLVQALAKELVATKPDVIFAQSRPVTATLQRETRTIPIVFTAVIDPVGAGFVDGLARPGGNITGFMVYEPSVVGKWLAMLKEIAPALVRVGLLGNPKTAAYYDYLLRAAESAAPSLGIEIVPSRVENAAADIERAIAALASGPNGGMFVLPDNTISINRDLIVALAARYRLPAVL
jgi:ABC transporter substrate binding protein